MQAIQTKYHGPTNTRGSRLTAKCDAGQAWTHYDHALTGQENHAAAAAALLAKLQWDRYGVWYGGQLPDGSYAWTCSGSALMSRSSIASTDTPDSIEEARR